MASDDDSLGIDLRPRLDEAAANREVGKLKTKLGDAGTVPVRPELDSVAVEKTVAKATGSLRTAGEKGGAQMGAAIDQKVSSSMDRVSRKVSQTKIAPTVDDSGLKKVEKSADDLGAKLKSVTEKAAAVKESIDNVDTGHNLSGVLQNAKNVGSILSALPGKLGKVGNSVSDVTTKAEGLAAAFRDGVNALDEMQHKFPAIGNALDDLIEKWPAAAGKWLHDKLGLPTLHVDPRSAPAIPGAEQGKKPGGSFYNQWYGPKGARALPGDVGFGGPLTADQQRQLEENKRAAEQKRLHDLGWDQPMFDHDPLTRPKFADKGEKEKTLKDPKVPKGTSGDPVHVKSVSDGKSGSASECWPWLHLGLMPPDISKFLPTADQLFGGTGAGNDPFAALAAGLGGGGSSVMGGGCSCESEGAPLGAEGVQPYGGSPTFGAGSAPQQQLSRAPSSPSTPLQDLRGGNFLPNLPGMIRNPSPATGGYPTFGSPSQTLTPFGPGGSSGGSLGDLLGGAAPTDLPTSAKLSAFRGGGPSDVAKYIYGAARSRGYSDADSTAIVAYSVGESGLNPRISGGIQGDDEVVGLFQEKSGFARSGGIDPGQRYTVEGNTQAYLNQLQRHRGQGDIMDQLLATSVGGPMYTGGRGYMDQLMGRARGYLGGGGSPIKANLTGFGVPASGGGVPGLPGIPGVPVGPAPGEFPGPIPGPHGPISGDIAGNTPDGGMLSNAPKKEAPIGTGKGFGLTGGGILGFAEQLPGAAGGAAGSMFGGGLAAAAYQDIAVPEINLGVQKGGQAAAALALAPMETMHLAGGQMGAPSVGSAGQSGWTGKLLGSLLGSQFNAANVAGSVAPPKNQYGSDQEKQQNAGPKGTADDPMHVNVLNGSSGTDGDEAASGSPRVPSATSAQGSMSTAHEMGSVATATPDLIG